MVGPGYDGPLPDSGYHVFHARTTRVTLIGRAFMVDNDPKIPVEAIRNGVRVYRYVPGAFGTAVGSFLAGQAPLGAAGLGARDPVRRGVGHGDQHSLPERLRLLGGGERLGAAGTTRGGRSRAARPARLRRHRARQAVRAGRQDAQDPRRRRRGRQRHRPHRHVRGTTRGRLRLLPELAMAKCAVRRRLPVPRPTTRDHTPRPGRGSRATVPASSTPPPTSSTWPPASRRRCACA